MNRLYEVRVILELTGPVITGSGTDTARGLNLVFARDAQGQVILRGSHIKGKLREALAELQSAKQLLDCDLNRYFGVGTEENNGDSLPSRGILRFYDFRSMSPRSDLHDSIMTRVAIDPQIGTAKEHALLTIEQCFPSGNKSKWKDETAFFWAKDESEARQIKRDIEIGLKWKGKIAFWAKDESEARQIERHIQIGLKWIAQIGAMKGTGCGNLTCVNTTLHHESPRTVISSPALKTDILTLRFTFVTELLIGGIIKGTNYQETETVIPGRILKGALARFLNEVCGNAKLATPISPDNALVAKRFPKLARFFSELRCSHAFSAPGDIWTRPAVIPFSTVQDDSRHPWDVAGKYGLAPVTPETQPIMNQDGSAPCYKINWKDDAGLATLFGWRFCQTVNTTRTAIHSETRTAKENQLYTFQALDRFDEEQQPVSWLATLRLPGEHVSNPQELAALRQEVSDLLNAGWCYAGKRDAEFYLEVKEDMPQRAKPAHSQGCLVTRPETQEQQAIVVLQSNALLCDGLRLAEQQEAVNLFEEYARYWKSVTDGSCELTGYLARQYLYGGYLTYRYKPFDFYYPYLLTEAGSVFVLRAADPNQAQTFLTRFEQYGLPLPPEIREAIQQQGKKEWEACPFRPQEGFGEICLNMDWHWNYHDILSKGEEL